MGLSPKNWQRLRCDLCWAEFDTADELARHEAAEDDRLYDLDADDYQVPAWN